MRLDDEAESPTDDERFRALLDSHVSSIERYCLRRLRPAVAEDAAAEVMLIAWRRIRDVPTGDEAKLWLFGVARRVVSTARRAERRRSRLDAKVMNVGPDEPDGPEMQVVRRVEDREVLDAMSRLKANDREILELRIWDDLSRSEVARLLNIGEAGVDKRLSRALHRLRRSLGARAERRPRETDGEDVRRAD